MTPKPNTTNQYEAVKAAIVAAVPEIEVKDHEWHEMDTYPWCSRCHKEAEQNRWGNTCLRPITLTDILLTLDKHYPETYAYQPTLGLIQFFPETNEMMLNQRDYIRTAIYFDHDKPLEDQSPEVIDFLYSVLVPNS